MDPDFHPEDEANRTSPAILYADDEYLAIVALSLESDEATTLPITELGQGSGLHRLGAGDHVNVSMSDRSLAHGCITDSASVGYDLEIHCAPRKADSPTGPCGASQDTADIVHQQLAEHLYRREELHVALTLDEPHAGPGADEECAYHNGAISALCEVAMSTGQHEVVAAADLQATTSLRQEAQESIEESQPQLAEIRQQIAALDHEPAVSNTRSNPYTPDPSGREQLTRRELELDADITFARAILSYLDGVEMEQD